MIFGKLFKSNKGGEPLPKQAELIAGYFAMGPEQLRGKLAGLSEEFIKQNAPANAVKNFKIAASSVPAYKKFLNEHNIDPENVNSFEDFKKLPMTNKENYLSKYPVEELVINGNLKTATAISVSSGSSGRPFYWPRNLEQDLNIAQMLESVFLENFEIDKKKTLHMTALGLGIWTGGDLLSMATRMFAQKGYDFVSINSGLDLETNVRLLKDLGSFFEQVVITAYPSFAKDLTEAAIAEGVDLNKLHVRFFFGGEPFAEEWRDYVFGKINGDSRYKNMCSCFGSSEGGIIGLESSLCIYVRKLCSENQELNEKLFNDPRVPSIVQFNPLAKYFESVDNELILTSLGEMPLIRYNTHDAGHIIYLSEFLGKLKENGIDAESELAKINNKIYWGLPIIYLFGRSDLTATIYAVNIYPENIRASLFDPDIRDLLSGKFYLQTVYNEGNQNFQITVELHKNAEESDAMKNLVKDTVVKTLKENNSEYKKLYSYYSERVEPIIILKKFGSPEFQTDNKLKYVK